MFVVTVVYVRGFRQVPLHVYVRSYCGASERYRAQH